jgi:sortase A
VNSRCVHLSVRSGAHILGVVDRLRSVLSGLGAILTGAGVLILLFVGYQLWGTGLYTSRQQGQLESKFKAQLQVDSPTTSTTGNPANLPPAPPTGEFVAHLKVPKIGLDQYVVQGVGLGDLRKGPGHYPETPLPGEQGNAAIAGHRTTYGAPFNRLGELVDGDELQVTTLKGTFAYKVARVHVVKPSQVEVLNATPTPTLTLTTCHPKYSAKERLIVVAHLAPGQTATAASPPPPTEPGEKKPLPGDALADAGLASDRSKITTTLWGLFTAAIGIGWWIAIRRRRDWLAYVGGVMPFLIALFFFYAHLELLLPANF